MICTFLIAHNESEACIMLVVIDGYEVEIKAKSEFSKRFNKEDTLNLLNTINVWQGAEADRAQARYNETGEECYKNYSKRVYEKCSKLHKFLDSFGIYDKFKN